jgi:hypothetical protein
VAGFEAGVDFRDVPPTEVELTHSVFVRMSVEDVAYVEDQPESDDGLPNEDDDGGFDELAWFEGGEGNTSEGPDLSFCFASTPSPGPAAMIPGGEPVGDALDPTATYVGAFKDASDDWMSRLDRLRERLKRAARRGGSRRAIRAAAQWVVAKLTTRTTPRSVGEPRLTR